MEEKEYKVKIVATMDLHLNCTSPEEALNYINEIHGDERREIMYELFDNVEAVSAIEV